MVGCEGWAGGRGWVGDTACESSSGSSTNKYRGSRSSSSSSSTTSSKMAAAHMPSVVLLTFPAMGSVVAAVGRLHTSGTAFTAEEWLDAVHVTRRTQVTHH